MYYEQYNVQALMYIINNIKCKILPEIKLNDIAQNPAKSSAS